MAYEAYANGWPDLKQLQELAEKVGNIPTFTSSDKEAIEDLISNAQALIEVAEDGAAGVSFDNTGTDFESTNVQGAIEEAAGMGGGNFVTDEREIGTYLGDTLYQKTARVLFSDLTDKSISADRCYGTLKSFVPDDIDKAWIDVSDSFYELKTDSSFKVISGPIINTGALSGTSAPYARATIQVYTSDNVDHYQLYFDNTVYSGNINNDVTAAYINVTIKYTKASS